jgi:outer membrane lipoprotein-sorting protein
MNKNLFFIIMVFIVPFLAVAQNAKEIVKKADEKTRGNSSQSDITIQIVRPTWTREMSMRSWSKGTDLALVLITAPAKDKGTVFLKRKREAWNWVPSIERTIKLPPSMMSQSWMGTDFTNDDMIKSTSIIDDFDQKIIGEQVVSGRNCYKIEMLPHQQAAIVWGKEIMWIDKTDYLILKTEFYDEDVKLVNTMLFSDIKKMGGRTIPTRMEMTPTDKPGNKTILIYNNMVFDKPVADNFFTTNNMKTVK